MITDYTAGMFIIIVAMGFDITDLTLQLKKEDGKTFVFDPVRKKWLVLTPEEHVRQYLLQYFIHKINYPASLIAVEKQIMSGSVVKRFDIVVYNRTHQPWLLVECKAPEVSITQATLHQLLNYQRALQCRYWVVSNGHSLYCADAADINNIKWSEDLPTYNG